MSLTAGFSFVRSLGAFCAVGLMLAACQPAAQAPAKEPLLVEAVTAQVSDISMQITLTGEIQADVASDIAFQTGGQVIERLVDVGDHVEVDQLLARLGSLEQTADRNAAQAALDAAQFSLEQANIDLERQRSLLDRGLNTRGEFDAAQEAVTTANSNVQIARTTLERAQEGINQTELRAFADGTITAREVEAGQVVQAGQPAFTLAVDGPREAVFDVDESVLTDIFAAQTFEVSSTGQPNFTASASLEDVSPTIDKSSGTVAVTLTLSSAPAEMTLGSVVTTTAQYLSLSAISIPAAALTSEKGHPAVWVLDPDSLIASRRPVELVGFNNTSLIIKTGVSPGELVVTSGANLVFPGQTVRIKQQP